MSTFVPGDANGLALKLKLPKIAAWADNEILQREDCRRLNVSAACERVLSQYTKGIFVSQTYIPAMRWFLKVRIVLSASLPRWRWWCWGGYQLELYICSFEYDFQVRLSFIIQYMHIGSMSMELYDVEDVLPRFGDIFSFPRFD